MTFSNLKPLATGTSEFVNHWRRVCDDLERAHRAWIARLRAEGVKAAHPDDGWVDRIRSTVTLSFPDFNDGAATGDLVALGSHDHHRLVRIVEVLPPSWMMDCERWRFVELTRKDG